MFRIKLIFATCLVCLMPLTHAQMKQSAGTCIVKASSGAVAILVCPAQSAEDAWRTAGEIACGSRLACNAWVWDENSKAPEVAPRTDADLPKSSSGQAVAIWINDSKSLVKLKKVGAIK